MFIKVCGLTDIDNANQIIDTGLVNMIGFNFYPFSKRYVDPTYIVNEPFDYIFPIGVFVNEKLETIKKISNDLLLTYIQLHGNEDQDYINECKKLQVGGIIKAVGIESKEDIQQAAAFNNIDYILFDKKSVEHGGTGEKFDWTLLKFYEGETPFFLAGGIGPEDAEKISEINHPKFAGIDINSRFELSPGIKNIKQIKLFLEKILQ